MTVEEGGIGGFGAHVLECASALGVLERAKTQCVCLPDEFIEQGIPFDMYEAAGLNASGIVSAALNALGEQPTALRKAKQA